jgi:hypothetical protein
VNNVGRVGCDILHAVDSLGENGKNCQKLTFGRFIKKTRMKKYVIFHMPYMPSVVLHIRQKTRCEIIQAKTL